MAQEFHNAEPSGVAWICLVCTARLSHLIFVGIPEHIVSTIPGVDGLLSGSFLYMFMQTLGLLWLFIVMLVSVLLVKFVACSISSCLIDSSPMPLAQQMVAAFVHFCVVRFLFHCGQNFWVIGWESFGDFATVQRLISGPRSSKSREASTAEQGTTDKRIGTPDKKARVVPDVSPKTKEDGSPYRHGRNPFHPAAIAAQKVIILSPGILLMVIHFFVTFSTAYCNSFSFWRGSVGHNAGVVWQWWATGNRGFCQGPIPDPASRLNSAIRFTIFAGYLQWVTASLRLFPTWYRALFINGHRLCMMLLAILAPLTILHIATMLPLLVGKERFHFISGALSNPQRNHFDSGLVFYVVDSAIIFMWMIWIAILDASLLQPTTITLSGWHAGFMKGKQWHEFTALLKYAFLCPVLLKFVWSCFFPGRGFAEAQTDTIMITMTYTSLLMVVWVFCFIVVDFPRKKRVALGTLISLGVAISLSIIAKADSLIITIIIWGHLLRKQLPWFGSTKRLALNPFYSETAASRYYSVFVRLGMSVLCGLVAVLIFLMLMSSLQDVLSWYPETIFMDAKDSKSGDGATLHDTHVAHTVSHLHLQSLLGGSRNRTMPQIAESSSAGLEGRYAICGQLFHGLSVLDYSLVALSAYWEPTSPDFSMMQQEFFPPWSDPPLTLRTVNHSRHGSMAHNRRGLYWVEYEVAELNTTLIGVRGTDPTKIADFIEDIRLWTEPVGIQLLSFALPSVRLWPHGTIEGVIQGGHAVLDFLGYSDNSWSYEGLLGHVERLRDQGKNVVLTGHSMGGGLAMIIAALASVPAVAITPPGIYQSMSKHRQHAKRRNSKQCDAMAETRPAPSVHYESLTLIVENDWVNGIFDSHGGLVQTMQCDRGDMGLQLQCHMLEGAICHIHRRCGDHRNRWDVCRHEYKLHSTIWDVLQMVTREAGTKLSGYLPREMASLAAPTLIIMFCLFVYYM